MKRHMGQMKIMQTKWLAAQMLVVCLLALVTAASAQPTIPTDRGGLLAGEGMGLAAPAERNGFPGPKHVLELKDSLRLSRDQAKRTEELVEGVKVSAIAKGEQNAACGVLRGVHGSH